jgi:hypothetical protein
MARMPLVEASSCFDIPCICTNSTQNSAVFVFCIIISINQPKRNFHIQEEEQVSSLSYLILKTSVGLTMVEILDS